MAISKNIRQYLAVTSIVLIAFVGIWLVTHGNAAAPTATASCGARVTPYNYQVPFGNAVWNQPVCGLPRYAKSADYANRFYKWSNMNDGKPENQGNNGRLSALVGIQPLYENWSRNVYYAKDATMQATVHSASFDSNLDGKTWNDQPLIPRPGYLSKNPTNKIPWNPAWQTGQASDNEIVILDESNGRIYEIFGIKHDPFAKLLQCGLYADRDICSYLTKVGRDVNGNYYDYRTFEGNDPSRGVGISSYATLVTPEEVLAGEIRHAIGFAIPNTSVGPVCTNAQRGTNAEGQSCGFAVSPASQVEWGGITVPGMVPAEWSAIYTQDKLIPEGMRFALDIDDAGIEAWINSRAEYRANTRLAQTARIFARALRDYGMIVADTGKVPAIQMAGAVNPQARQLWSNVGLNEQFTGDTLFSGLITAQNLYVVEPPTSTCVDGSKTKYFCNWTSASYGTGGSDTTLPTVSITSPQTGAQLTGNFVINATASDNVAVTKVEVLVDSVIKNTYTSQPYSLAFDSKSLPNGVHTIMVRAYDAAGNIGSQSIGVTFSNTTPETYNCDFDNNGKVNIDDLARLLGNWGLTVPRGTNGDCDYSGDVKIRDLGILLGKYEK